MLRTLFCRLLWDGTPLLRLFVNRLPTTTLDQLARKMALRSSIFAVLLRPCRLSWWWGRTIGQPAAGYWQRAAAPAMMALVVLAMATIGICTLRSLK